MGRKKLPDSRDDMATRSYSTTKTSRKQSSSTSHSKKNASTAINKGKAIYKPKSESNNAQSNAVPHVVRVTFLGVAGISANSPSTDGQQQQQSDNNNNSSSSLNFPLPSNLRAVASVSRTYKSGGKPSGLSNCLTKPPPPATTGGSGRRRSKTSQDDNGRNNNNKGDGVEIVRPYTPNRMEGDDKPDEVNKSSSSASSSSAGSGGQQSERFVAVWNDDCSINDDVGTNQKLLNTSNAVAFEAELVPSSLDENEKNLPASNVGAFAPKNFCVTLALVPDNNDENEIISNNNEMPLFGIPIGFCNLTINGEETLNGRRRQLDLPLSSFKDFIGPLDRQSPLIQLTKADDNNVNDVKSSETKKTKKSKSIVKRIFKKSGKKGANNGTTTSIFQLGRPPTAEERNLFLERFGVDQSGDAIIRIALEVFPRGSALEKTFRHAAKLRKRRQRKKAEEREAGASVSPDSIDLSAATSSSLVDDGSSASDYSHMSSDEGSWDDDHTGSWDDEGETYYTFDDTVMKGSTKPSNKSVFGRMFDCGICASDTDYIDERTIDEYNIDSVASAVASMDKRAIDEYNIDTVASAMASMSMSEHGHDADNDEQSALATQNQVSNQNP